MWSSPTLCPEYKAQTRKQTKKIVLIMLLAQAEMEKVDKIRCLLYEYMQHVVLSNMILVRVAQ